MKRCWKFLGILTLGALASCTTTSQAPTGAMNAGTQGPSAQWPGGQWGVTPVSKAAPEVFSLAPGDEIEVQVWRQDDLKRSTVIDPVGYISLPLAGRIKAAGLSVTQLRAEVVKGLSEFIVNPQVDVNVVSIRSRKIHVLGEVNRPGTQILEAGTKTWEAIAKAGGFTQDANTDRVLLLRSEPDATTAEVLDLNLERFIKEGRPTTNASLRNGDIVYVPTLTIANVEKFMQRLQSIINPFVTAQRAVILAPDTVDALGGSKNGRVIIAP
jgi:polysaccharide biosynthesis/export protein